MSDLQTLLHMVDELDQDEDQTDPGADDVVSLHDEITEGKDDPAGVGLEQD